LAELIGLLRRFAIRAPGGPAIFSAVTVDEIRRLRLDGGAISLWPRTTSPRPLYYQTPRDDATQTSSSAIPLTNTSEVGFHFRLVGPEQPINSMDFFPVDIFAKVNDDFFLLNQFPGARQ